MDTKKLQWVFEQINARRNPITEEQLDQFCMNPNGPLLPGGLVEAKRLPMNDGEACINIAVDPTGTPCYVFKGREQSRFRVVRGEDSWLLGATPGSEIKNVFDNIARLGEVLRGVRVIGFDKNNTPITEARFKSYVDSDAPTNLPDLLFCGSQHLWDPQKDPQTPIGIDAERNVFMTAPCRDRIHVRDLTTGGLIRTIQLHEWRYSNQAFLAPDGSLYVIGGTSRTGNHYSIARYNQNDEQVTWVKPAGEIMFPCDHVYEIVTIDGITHLVLSQSRERCFTKLFILESIFNEDMWRILEGISSCHAYLRGLQRLKNGSWAYVGLPTRHDGECYFVDDKEHPRFNRVSRLFLQDGYWHYYGLTMDGRHVCLMHL